MNANGLFTVFISAGGFVHREDEEEEEERNCTLWISFWNFVANLKFVSSALKDLLEKNTSALFTLGPT